MIRRQKQKEVSQTKIADKIIKNVEDNMTKRDEEMSGSMMFLEELIKAGKTPQAIVMAGEEEDKTFGSGNVMRMAREAKEEETVVTGTIGEDPETGEMYIEVELEDEE